jgi:hypothetical protein
VAAHAKSRRCSSAGPRSEHEVHGKGDDAGLVFLYRWVPVTTDLELFNRLDPMPELL